MKFTVGVAAYNEELGIRRILDFLLSENVPEIVVYNDGSFDRTQNILEEYRGKPNTQIINSRVNRGYGFVLNTLLNESSNDIVIMTDADTLPMRGAIHLLASKFNDESVGAVSGTHMTDINLRKNIIACVSWRIYRTKRLIDISEYNENNFKHLNGLLFGVRKSALPNKLLTVTNQDAYLGWLVTKRGYRAVFVDEAKSLFKPAISVRDYLNSRKRVIRGHMVLGYKLGVPEYTWHECSLSKYVFCVLTAIPAMSIRGWLSLVFGAVVDMCLRLYWFSKLRRNPQEFEEYRWEQTKSTKW